jgi:hypothetical protein
VQLDEPVEQFQAPATFVVGSDVLADRSPHAAVMDFDPQATIGIRQPHLDQPGTMTQRVGHQLTHDELGQVSVLVQAPSAQSLARLFAGAAGVRRLAAEPAGDGHFAGSSQRHSALLTGTWSDRRHIAASRCGERDGIPVLSVKGGVGYHYASRDDPSVTPVLAAIPALMTT